MIPILSAIGSILIDKGIDTIGSLLSSGIDDVADKTADFIKDKTGIDLKQNQTATLNAEQIKQLRELEIKEKTTLMEIRARLIESHLKDVENARDMQKVALKQGDIFSKRFVYYFALGWSVFAMLYLLFITFLEIPQENIRFADTILGFLLGTIIGAIIQFFYGSSIGSKNKDEILGGKK